MKAYWSSVDGEYDDYEADVINCIKKGDEINILFVTQEDGQAIQGRLSLVVTNEEQSTKAVWIYADTKKEVPKICDSKIDSEESIIEAEVSGKIRNFGGNKVMFEGKWKDNDGAEYDFDFDVDAVLLSA